MGTQPWAHALPGQVCKAAVTGAPVHTKMRVPPVSLPWFSSVPISVTGTITGLPPREGHGLRSEHRFCFPQMRCLKRCELGAWLMRVGPVGKQPRECLFLKRQAWVPGLELELFRVTPEPPTLESPGVIFFLHRFAISIRDLLHQRGPG